MKHLGKTVILSCAVWAAGMGFTSPQAQAYPLEYGVKVQVNDSLIQFAEASPFIDGKGVMQVPIRDVAERLGCKVDWRMDGSAVEVTIRSESRSITLKTGSADAWVNGKAMKMESPALFQGGKVFVPVRFVSESFGYMVQWDNNNGIAIICQDGKYHAPAWYAPVKPATAAASLNARLVDTAKNYIGVRYVYGGTSTNGFDCSGFVNYVFSQYGIDLPRTSRGMYDYAGTSVTALQPGDLVFFNISKSTTHVGIYLGNDQFISATTSRGVKIDSLASNYWGSRYIGAKRVL